MRIDLPERLGGAPATLRPLRTTDAPAYAAAFRADADLGRLLGLARDPDEASVRARVESQPERASDGRGAELAIADPDTDEFLGAVILHSFDWESRRCEVGFWVVPAARRRGLASAAVALVTDWIVRDLNLLRVEMTTTPENPAVPALARRLGFTQEGVLRARNIERGQRVDIIWFGLLAEEWSGG